jgi:P-type Ca2+ transporter type 2C
MIPSSPAPSIPRGLTAAEAETRLERHGANEIRGEKGPSPFRILLGQFRGAMVWLLLGACILSIVLGETVDAVAIAVILVLNALIGFLQEYRAERAVDALRAMTAPHARVVRDGRTVSIPAREVVPGDHLILEAGDLVAADARVTEAHLLATNEAPLTGESMPVDKDTRPAAADAPLAERHDRVFMGTAVAAGTGGAEVVATGTATELGKIAGLLTRTRDEPTPLQRRLERVGHTLLLMCLGIVAVVAGLGVVQGRPWTEVLIAAVTLAVAAVPEGLGAIVTIALAIGVQRMAGRNVLVRKLPAVETLGSATVICTDKTGTLTTGAMTVRELWGPDHPALLDAAAACCNAELEADGVRGNGDATEIAILAAAHARGIDRPAIEAARPRVAELPFDAVRKRMSIKRADGTLYVKGAVDLLLPLCVSGTEGAAAANLEMAGRGIRVIGVAVGGGDDEQDLRLLGLIGLADPPRTEAIEAVRQAGEAGIRTVMITGDHPATAAAIARELGIVRAGDDPSDLVHARATPEDKLKIVRDWKQRGAVVAMTGDGVNDAPALREADIGVAMGKDGTEVARQASDMILADDNFASIVAAIREGRGIFDNIRKTLVYLLAGNASELLLMLAASLMALPLPLTPIQILWINLVTDGLPALALVMDQPEPDVLARPPRSPGEQILTASQWRMIVLTGLLESAIVLGVYAWALEARGLTSARTLAFTVLVFAEVLRSFAMRSDTRLFWEVGVFTNLRLLGVVVLSVGIQLALSHLEAGQRIFDITGLSAHDTLLGLGLGLIPVSVLEIAKLLRRL